MDVTRSGKVILRNIISGMAQVLTTHPREHADIFFELQDTDESGYLERSEVRPLLREREKRCGITQSVPSPRVCACTGNAHDY